MTTSIVPSLQEHNTISEKSPHYQSQHCTLHWRRGQLLVKFARNVQQPYLPSLDNQQSLIECLKHSPISLVTIEPQLGNAVIKFWAEACQAANKPIYISSSARNKGTKPSNQFLRLLKPKLDWILALILLIFLSPLMLGLAILIRLDSSPSLFDYHWQINENGKIFPAVKFCNYTKHHHRSLLGLLMSKYRLEYLPRLLNVLHGDMSLIGCNLLSLEDVTQLSLSAEIQPLEELPEVINSWQIKSNLSPARSS
jgi:lipopolysaccharide/colanic/teichoic acid biosynthesis glycosyltransferase